MLALQKKTGDAEPAGDGRPASEQSELTRVALLCSWPRLLRPDHGEKAEKNREEVRLHIHLYGDSFGAHRSCTMHTPWTQAVLSWRSGA